MSTKFILNFLNAFHNSRRQLFSGLYYSNSELYFLGYITVTLYCIFRATLNKKVRNAQLAQYNFIFVVGEKERDAGKVVF